MPLEKDVFKYFFLTILEIVGRSKYFHFCMHKCAERVPENQSFGEVFHSINSVREFFVNMLTSQSNKVWGKKNGTLSKISH